MIKIIPVSAVGITSGIDDLIKRMKDNPNELVSVARVHDGDKNYSFIALFLEKGTIGQYVAFLQEWGTTDGTGVHGGGGFLRINEFLSENGINAIDIKLSSKDYKKLGYMKNYIEDTTERLSLWQKYVLQML